MFYNYQIPKYLYLFEKKIFTRIVIPGVHENWLKFFKAVDPASLFL